MRRYYPSPGHYHGHQPHPHLPSFQSQFHFNESVPPPNTQAPAGPPVPTSGGSSYCLYYFRCIVRMFAGATGPRYPGSQHQIRTSSAQSGGSAFQSLEVRPALLQSSVVTFNMRSEEMRA